MLPANFPEFRVTTCTKPQPDVLNVRWSIMPTDYNLGDIAFEIFRSNGPKGPWELVGTVEGIYRFTDFGVLSPGNARTYYYIVRAASKSKVGFRDSAAFILEHDPDDIALELVRKKNLYLQVKSGIAAGVLLKKTWGARCARCFSTEKQLATDPDCISCYGTGFSGGFMNPCYIPILWNPPIKVLLSAGVQLSPRSTYAECANAPVLSPDDVLVDRTLNQRYRIDKVTQSTRRGHLISQIVTLDPIDDHSIVYTIEIPPPPHMDEQRSFDLRGADDPITTLGVKDSVTQGED